MAVGVAADFGQYFRAGGADRRRPRSRVRSVRALLPVLLLVVLVVAATAVVLAVIALRRLAEVRRAPATDALPEDVHGLRQEVAALRAETRDALRHLSVVRYDAFGDMGGHLSWSLALLDDSGHGVVLASVHGRSEARTYAKSVTGWTCEQQLSPEEEEAIRHARPSK